MTTNIPKDLKLVNQYMNLINEKSNINKRLDEIESELNFIKRRLNESRFFELNEETESIEFLNNIKYDDSDDENAPDNDEFITKLPKLIALSKSKN